MEDVGDGPGLLMKMSRSVGSDALRTRRMMSSASVPVICMTPVTATALENSDVLPAALVAVAVIMLPGEAPGTLMVNVASPEVSVLRVVEVRKVRPSPKPVGSAAALLKKSISKVELGV